MSIVLPERPALASAPEEAPEAEDAFADWNKDAPSVMVYFKTETASAASTSGSNFTAGNLALAGGAGLAFGALVSAIAVTAADKKKSKKPAA